ncbi:hypothetical protein J7K97_07145 [Candidatus Aerophobetes bacterium]|nr:hypothetical protein [Candidatus Aerophobetes bacterium]
MRTHFLKSPQPATRNPQPERALTLVELLVAGVIVGVVFLGIITMFIAGQKSFTNTSEQAVNQHKANLAMEYVIKGVREVGIDISETFGSATPSDGDTDIWGSPAEPHGLTTLYVDKDNSGDESDDDEKYKYWLDGTDFKKCTWIYNSGWPAACDAEEIITQISALEFRYCEAGGGLNGCATDSDGIEIKVTSKDNEDYISKVPYSY